MSKLWSRNSGQPSLADRRGEDPGDEAGISWTSCVFLHNALPKDTLKTKMALIMDDVSPQLAFEFTSSSFDPEKCKAGKITSNLIIYNSKNCIFAFIHDKLERPSFV